MKYVCDVCGWEKYDEEEGYLKVVLHQEQSGRMFQEDFECPLCNVGKISFQKLNKKPDLI